MKLTITIDPEVIENYVKKDEENNDYKKVVDEKIATFKGNKKKLEKDEVYMKAGYNMVISAIEMVKYREDIINEVVKAWKEKSVNSKQRNPKAV